MLKYFMAPINATRHSISKKYRDTGFEILFRVEKTF